MTEVWAIRFLELGHLVPPIDDGDTECFIAWPSREEAEKGLLYQLRQGYLDEGECVIERLFPKEDT